MPLSCGPLFPFVAGGLIYKTLCDLIFFDSLVEKKNDGSSLSSEEIGGSHISKATPLKPCTLGVWTHKMLSAA